MMYSAILANLLATGCAILLVRRGPSPRLRQLTLVVGIVSLSQTAALLHAQGIWYLAPQLTTIHQLLAAAFSLCALHLLRREIADRNLTDRRLRLAEYEAVQLNQRIDLPAPKMEIPAPPPAPASPAPDMTADLLNLWTAVMAAQPTPATVPVPNAVKRP